MDDVVEIIHPDLDSHFRLRACESCGGAAVYEKYLHPAGGERWRVACTACDAVVDLQGSVRHEVQVEWNRRNNRGEIDGKTRRRRGLHRKAH